MKKMKRERERKRKMRDRKRGKRAKQGMACHHLQEDNNITPCKIIQSLYATVHVYQLISASPATACIS